jgi:chromosome segregation ATPase
MLVLLGFLIASLLGLLVASAFWARAVRLTTARIRQSMPVSEPEIKADRDRLRAEHAITAHKRETQLAQAKLERARLLIEINRRDASISALEGSMLQVKAELEENQNARRVLEQTVIDRLPKVEARLAEAKRLLFNRDREIADLAAGAKKHKLALEEVTAINVQQSAQIERLTSAAGGRGGRGRRSAAEAPSEGGAALRTEVEALRAKTREQAALVDRLQRRPGQGYAVAVPPADGEMERVRKDLSDAESTLNSVRAGAPDAEELRTFQEGELRALRARAEDQAGEIARLKAALAAFEERGGKDGALKDSKIALKARLGSAQAQADQQAQTIAKLRAELAAAHERLARQATQFRDEVRRIGGTGSPSMRDAARRSLAERVAQVRPTLAVDSANGRAEGLENGALAGKAHAEEPEAVEISAEAHGDGSNGTAAQAVSATTDGIKESSATAAEMPKDHAIPEERRKPRLLDRITSLTKS